MKILIATDGSKFSVSAVKAVCRFIGGAKNAEIRIFSAYQLPMSVVAAAAPYAVPYEYSPALEKQMRDSAAESVAKAERLIRERCPQAVIDVTTNVVCGSPEREIVEEAGKWGADLIVTGSHGYGFWSRTLLGSVSNSVAHHAPCSV